MNHSANVPVSTNPPPTLTSVAKLAKVSRMAAARVLLGTGKGRVRVGRDTAERIHKAARKLDYRPNLVAQQLAGKSSNLIGVVIDSFAPSVHYSILALIERGFAAKGYRLMIGQVHGELDSIAAYVDDFQGRGVEAAVFMSHRYPDISEEAARLFQRLNHVVCLEPPDWGTTPYVAVDIATGIKQAVEHLKATGRSRIGMGLPSLLYPAAQARRRAYLEALYGSNDTPDESLLWLGDGLGTPARDQADRVVDHLVVNGKADAIIAANDIWAVWIIKALKRRNIRVPEDVAVIGFDNIDVAEMVDPELTTIDPDTPQVARQIVDMTCAQLDPESRVSGEDAPCIVVTPRLVVRQSG